MTNVTQGNDLLIWKRLFEPLFPWCLPNPPTPVCQPLFVEIQWPDGKRSSRFRSAPWGTRSTQTTVAVTAFSQSLHQPLSSAFLRSPSPKLWVGHNKGSPFLSLQYTRDQSTGAASSRPLLYPGITTQGWRPSSQIPQGPAASPAAATLGPGHCGRLCGGTALRPVGHWTLVGHLLPGTLTASSVREISPLPSRVSTRASGREILGVKRQTPDSSPLRWSPDTARRASGKRGGQIQDPGIKLGEGREFISWLRVCSLASFCGRDASQKGSILSL